VSKRRRFNSRTLAAAGRSSSVLGLVHVRSWRGDALWHRLLRCSCVRNPCLCLRRPRGSRRVIHMQRPERCLGKPRGDLRRRRLHASPFAHNLGLFASQRFDRGWGNSVGRIAGESISSRHRTRNGLFLIIAGVGCILGVAAGPSNGLGILQLVLRRPSGTLQGRREVLCRKCKVVIAKVLSLLLFLLIIINRVLDDST